MLAQIQNFTSSLPKYGHSRIGKLILKQRLDIFLIFITSSFVNILLLTPMLYMLQIFDRIFISKSLITLLTVSIVVMFLYFISAFCSFIRSRIAISLGMKIEEEITTNLFYSSVKKHLRSGSENPASFLDDLTMVRQWMTGNMMFVVFDTPWIPFYVFVMFIMDPILGYTAILLIILFISLGFFLHWLIGSSESVLFDEEKESNSFIYRNVRNSDTFYLYAVASQIKKIWWTSKLRFYNNILKYEKKNSAVTNFMKQFRFLVSSIALTVGALLVINDRLSMGTMIAAALLMARCTAPVDSLIMTITRISSIRDAFWRIEGLLESFASDLKKKDSMKYQSTSSSKSFLEVKELCCKFGEKRILDNLNFTLEKGTVLGVIGRSGSGKTSLTKVMASIMEYEGEVKFAGNEIRNLSDDKCRKMIGYLPQRHGLFTGTIAENISSLEPPNSDRIIEVSKMVNIHEMILRMPQGYETFINGSNVFLSGGEVQRICIARAIYHNPECIILDEPNSALDKPGEQYLSDLVKSLKMQDKLVVIVSHRKGIIKEMDRILELNEGKQVIFCLTKEYLENVSNQEEFDSKFTD